MVPISCNAFGDIVAVVQLVREIVLALDDARGAAQEYKQFVHVLTTLGTVMEEVFYLANDSQNEALKQAMLAEIRRACGLISSATDSIAGFDRLRGDASALSSGRDHSRELLSKLRWRFLRASDAENHTKRLSESLQRLNAFIGILG